MFSHATPLFLKIEPREAIIRYFIVDLEVFLFSLSYDLIIFTHQFSMVRVLPHVFTIGSPKDDHRILHGRFVGTPVYS